MSPKPDTANGPVPTIQLADHHQKKAAFRVSDLAAYGFTKSHTHALIRDGKLTAFHVAGCVVIGRQSLIDFLASAKVITPKGNGRTR